MSGGECRIWRLASCVVGDEGALDQDARGDCECLVVEVIESLIDLHRLEDSDGYEIVALETQQRASVIDVLWLAGSTQRGQYSRHGHDHDTQAAQDTYHETKLHIDRHPELAEGYPRLCAPRSICWLAGSV